MGDLRRAPLAVVAALIAACSFKGGASPGDGDATPDASSDAPSDAPGGDADTVCDTLTLKLTVNGDEVTDFGTRLLFAVGDSIALNAGASCSPTGNINFSWTPDSNHFGTRDGTDLSNFFIEVYPDDVGDLTLTVTIDDGVSPELTQAIPIAGVGFSALDIFDGNTATVHEMLIADGSLWLATAREAVTQTLDALDTVPYEAVNSVSTNNTATIPSDVSRVAYDSDNDVVSFMATGGDGVFFFDRAADDITEYTGATGTLRDLQAIANGLRLLTDQRTEESTDYQSFDLHWNRDRSAALTEQGGDILAGGERLFRFVDADNSMEREIFNEGNGDDDGIVAFFTDADGALWIGSAIGDATTGIAVIDDFDDATIDEHLLGERVHGIDQDGDGDMWVATADGVFRFKADWGVWISFGAKHGLTTVESRSLLVDQGGGRDQVLVGTTSDLFRLPKL